MTTTRIRDVPLALMLMVAASNTYAAAENICTQLLSNGVFETRKSESEETHWARLKYVFCRKDVTTLSKARAEANAYGLNIPGWGSGSLDSGKSEAEFQQARHSLCVESDYASADRYWNKQDVKVASIALLEAFNRCIKREGLTQYAFVEKPSQKTFVWTVKYEALGTPYEADVVATSVPDGVCRYNGKVIPPKLTVGKAGVNLTCTRNKDIETLLVINSPAAPPYPPQIVINATAPQTALAIELGPYRIVGDQFKKPFSFNLPLGLECAVRSANGGWYPHCPNKQVVAQCPTLAITPGAASSGNYDHIWDDNCGECEYNLVCVAPSATKNNSVAKKTKR